MGLVLVWKAVMRCAGRKLSMESEWWAQRYCWLVTVGEALVGGEELSV